MGAAKMSWSLSICWSRRVRPRSTMTTTAAHAQRHAAQCDRRPRPKDVLRARPDRGSVHHRCRRSREHPTRAGAGRAQHPRRRARRTTLFLDALARAVAFGRWRAADVRSILAAGTGTPQPTTAGDALVLELPRVPTRSLSDTCSSATKSDCSPRRHRCAAVVPVHRRRLRTPRPGHRLPLALRILGSVPPRAHHRGQPA